MIKKNTFFILFVCSTFIYGQQKYYNDVFIDVIKGALKTKIVTKNSTACDQFLFSDQILATTNQNTHGNRNLVVNNLSVLTKNGIDARFAKIFFSNYLKSSSNNKALKLFNLTDENIDFKADNIKKQSNSRLNNSDWEFNFPLKRTIVKSKNVFVSEAIGEHPPAPSQKTNAVGYFVISITDSIRFHNGNSNFEQHSTPVHSAKSLTKRENQLYSRTAIGFLNRSNNTTSKIKITSTYNTVLKKVFCQKKSYS